MVRERDSVALVEVLLEGHFGPDFGSHRALAATQFVLHGLIQKARGQRDSPRPDLRLDHPFVDEMGQRLAGLVAEVADQEVGQVAPEDLGVADGRDGEITRALPRHERRAPSGLGRFTIDMEGGRLFLLRRRCGARAAEEQSREQDDGDRPHFRRVFCHSL